MENNIGKKSKSNKGITLVALVVTIIVLLILAGVSLSAVFSQQGIFNRAENAVDKNSQSKARETLDLVFSEAQMKKYDEGLSEEELNKMVETVGQLLSKDDPESKYQLVIVDGYIFEIDRSVPKVVEYKGPADGIIITATVSGNNGWVKPGEGKVSITGTIKTYSGGTITTVSAKNGEILISDFSIGEDGRYTIDNITEDTIITINAEDSNKMKSEKTVEVKVRVDNIPPKVDTVTATAERMTIRISAKGTDNETGIKQFNYKITPTEGIPANKVSGTILIDETAEIITESTGVDEKEYTIIVTATDNAGNTTHKEEEKTATVITENYLTVSEAKAIVRETNLQQYIGMKVKDYIPKASGTWRIFYYDVSGEFGISNAIYIKRDLEPSESGVNLSAYANYKNSDRALETVKHMNPQWAKHSAGNSIDLSNENAVAWLCDKQYWEEQGYVVGNAKFAIGAPSLEMWVRAYNVYVSKYEPDKETTICGIINENGYGVGPSEGNLSTSYYFGSVQKNDRSKVIFGVNSTTSWLASPHYQRKDAVHQLEASSCSYGYVGYTYTWNLCPVVCI